MNPSPITSTSARRGAALRHGGALLGTTAVLVMLSPGLAAAVPGEGWAEAPEVSTLQLLTIIALIPIGLAVVLTLVFALPGLASDRSGGGSDVPATWMGGPKEGTDTLPEGSSAVDDTGSDARGGASASW